jgi:U3 small nucleolar RNA-associated protein 10
VAIGSEQKAALSASGKKKRSHGEYVEDLGGDSEVPAVTVELTNLVKKILSFVTVSCTHGTQQFMTESRYQTMMAPAVALMPLRVAFCNEKDCLTFVHESVNLASAITVDILWKPLNHKVLLAMRDKKKVVRMADMSSTLHSLFSEVGEEYLLLLPECLLFLSELIEDDSREIAKDTLRFLEELSGEKLESYLQ